MNNEATKFSPQDRPVVNPLYVFRWEETQRAWGLLSPEGVEKLNDSADGRTIADLVSELQGEFDAGEREVETGVYNFLEASHAKGWIRRQA